MKEEVSAYQQLLLDRYSAKVETYEEKMLLIEIGIGPKEYGFEDEMMEYLRNHPNASLQEVQNYAEPFFPELEIVDDDDLDEEWEE